MTSLAAKKLDHDIMKAHDDKFERYRQCLENKVVREAPSLEPSLCVVLVVVQQSSVFAQAAAEKLYNLETDPQDQNYCDLAQCLCEQRFYYKVFMSTTSL